MSNSQEEVDMIVLATVKDGYIIELNQEALKVIEDFIKGQIRFIGLEGFQNKNYKIRQTLTKSRLISKNPGQKLWIRKQPFYDDQTSKYMFFVETQMHDDSSKQLLHILVSLISYAVIVAFEDQDDLQYLTCNYERVSYGKYSAKHKESEVIDRIAQLMCLTSSAGDIPSGNHELRDKTDYLLTKLDKQGITNKIMTSYPFMKCLGTNKKDLEFSSTELQKALFEEIQISCVNVRPNSDLMYGPIIVQFIKLVVSQLNNYKSVDIEKAQNNIQIEEAYQAYNLAIKKYHSMSLGLLNKFEHPSNQEIDESLVLSKKSAIQEYFGSGGASNLKYKQLLNDYISHKEKDVKKAYSDEQYKKNLQILQSESNALMQEIRKNNKQEDTKFIKQKLDIMKANYQQNAKGPEKYSLYNDYIKMFTPVVYGYESKQEKLKKSQMKHAQLQKKLDQLQKKKGCCGGKCSIM